MIWRCTVASSAPDPTDGNHHLSTILLLHESRGVHGPSRGAGALWWPPRLLNEAAASLAPVRGLRFVEDGERRRSGRAWLLATPPALPPGAPLHPRHKLLDAII